MGRIFYDPGLCLFGFHFLKSFVCVCVCVQRSRLKKKKVLNMSLSHSPHWIMVKHTSFSCCKKHKLQPFNLLLRRSKFASLQIQLGVVFPYTIVWESGLFPLPNADLNGQVFSYCWVLNAEGWVTLDTDPGNLAWWRHLKASSKQEVGTCQSLLQGVLLAVKLRLAPLVCKLFFKGLLENILYTPQAYLQQMSARYSRHMVWSSKSD